LEKPTWSFVLDNIGKYVNQFFDDLEVYEDNAKGHFYKTFLRQAVNEFLELETKGAAFAVYEYFFSGYRIKLEGASNPFIDLMDVLRCYEENAATLIDKQRDHFIHSVNVFILGLCVYSQNTNFRVAFNERNLNKSEYPFSYSTRHEEFFYRWGIASLFHDVGYPVEIVGRQLTKFIDFVTEVDSGIKATPYVEFDNFDALNSISEVAPRREFTKFYSEKYVGCDGVDLLKPVDLLAHKLHTSLGVDLLKIQAVLNDFVHIMAKSGFIDHGFYSAVIVLKWYGFLIQNCKYKSEYFYYPILDSASAILLHNFYRNVIMKPPFGKGSLSPDEHAIAFLLILCDELQEWNREAYGIIDKKRNRIGQASLVITEQRLDVTYLVGKGTFPEQFSAGKEGLLNELLDLNAVFPGGFSVGCVIMEDLANISSNMNEGTIITPRPLLDNLERLAIAIHERFNQKLLERHPKKALPYPRFTDLPDSMKYSNMRQARGISRKLELMGWEMRPKGSPGEQIIEISDDIIEMLARFEHEEWVQERLDSGWEFGGHKDVVKKKSPFLVPYKNLEEEQKDQDRDTVRNIPDLLDMIGMAIYVRDS
jgi:hypothetical protein